MQARIHIITLGVRDMARALEFYEKGLNFKRSDASQGDIVFFSLGGLALALYPLDKLATEVGLAAKAEDQFSGITFAYNTQSKQEVDDILRKVDAIGGRIVQPAKEVFWGGYSGYFADPDNHIFEVAYNPFVTFTENNQLIL